MAELLEQIRRLSVREQLALIREITLNLESASDNKDEWELSPAQQQEMIARAEEAKRDGYAGDDWPTVRARIEAQLAQNQAATEAVAA